MTTEPPADPDQTRRVAPGEPAAPRAAGRGGFDHPFFRPLWVRVLTVALPALWGVFELFYASPLWGALFLAAAAWAAHDLFGPGRRR